VDVEVFFLGKLALFDRLADVLGSFVLIGALYNG